VSSVHLLPSEAADLVAGITQSLASLASAAVDGDPATRVGGVLLEQREES